jgi:hypothetical protein
LKKCRFIRYFGVGYSLKLIFAKQYRKMLTLDQLRKDTPFAKERLAHKNFKDIHFVDEIIALDDKRKLVKS